MTDLEAMEIVEELSVLKDFPRSAVAKSALAGKMQDWCEGKLDRARWLVDEGISGLDEYPGPETLRQLIACRFPKPVSKPRDSPSFGPPECGQCGDLGTYFDSKLGRNVWCSCDQAKRLEADMPNWLKVVNHTRMPGSRGRNRDDEVRSILQHLTDGYGGESQ